MTRRGKGRGKRQQRQRREGFRAANYDTECMVCGQLPTMPGFDMCATCVTGEAGAHMEFIDAGGFYIDMGDTR